MRDNPLPASAVESLPVRFPSSYRYAPQFRPWLQKNLERYDGVVLHGMWTHPNWVAYQECRRQAKSYACFPHGMLEPWPVFGQGRLTALKKMAYWNLRERFIFGHGAAALFTTEREARLAGSTFKLPSVPHVVVPYGVSISNRSIRYMEKPGFLIPDGKKVALFLGRLHPKKNVTFLLDAWADARPVDDWILIIAGPGDPDYVRSLALRIQNLGLNDSVKLVGEVAGGDKTYLFQRSHWFLLPSSQENFSNATLEAIQYGCPVAISDQVYFSEFLHKSSEVLPVTHAAWVAFIKNRMADEPRRLNILELDQVLVKPRFEIKEIAKAWAGTMRKIFGDREIKANHLFHTSK